MPSRQNRNASKADGRAPTAGTPVRVDVVVVGAGVAGLAAARALVADGLDVLLVEARSRVGGRILTHREAGLTTPVELGAEFVHGEAQEIQDLAKDAGLRAAEVAGRRWRVSRGKQVVGGKDAPALLARPVRGTLFFASEATASDGRIGTVDGAIASGRRAATAVVRALERGTKAGERRRRGRPTGRTRGRAR